MTDRDILLKLCAALATMDMTDTMDMLADYVFHALGLAGVKIGDEDGDWQHDVAIALNKIGVTQFSGARINLDFDKDDEDDLDDDHTETTNLEEATRIAAELGYKLEQSTDNGKTAVFVNNDGEHLEWKKVGK